jgi:uncharacterized protein (DUF2062 family)
VAAGFGLGVFLGIFPGTGPIASLFLAWVFKLNRASALLGCILTNSWISLVTFILSIKLGSVILKVNWREVYDESFSYIKDFKLFSLFKLSILEVVFPVILGYVILGLLFGLVAYIIALLIVRRKR